eukprot:TRINITY_DN19235_c0_g1_i1.p1 TRINITY_DN19235_c0_g1~~TRINITY_DN19235_c0_g1_i1.p1  ORF type:complete len:207 (+),score=15.34 TRINITY_DN19235_c0_g1_i1:67-687(+)
MIQLSLTIYHMDAIVPDPLAFHPIVRVFVVNSKTGESTMNPVTTVTPQNTYEPWMHKSKAKDFHPVWNQRLDLAIPTIESLLLFEVLGCGSLVGRHVASATEGLYPIAWTYLLVNTLPPNNKVAMTLNLYRYPSSDQWMLATLKRAGVCFRCCSTPKIRPDATEEFVSANQAPWVYFVFLSKRNLVRLFLLLPRLTGIQHTCLWTS